MGSHLAAFQLGIEGRWVGRGWAWGGIWFLVSQCRSVPSFASSLKRRASDMLGGGGDYTLTRYFAFLYTGLQTWIMWLDAQGQLTDRLFLRTAI